MHRPARTGGLPGSTYSCSGSGKTLYATPIVAGQPEKKSGRTVKDFVGTKQVAPTILALLDADPHLLQAVVAENARLLPGLGIGRSAPGAAVCQRHRVGASEEERGAG
ncbi:hypothetical protein CFB81_27465 [Burkholderia sp. AU28863]|nr:hypothetical protein CFB81_27465 [Burkholderia sp. AU28863]